MKGLLIRTEIHPMQWVADVWADMQGWWNEQSEAMQLFIITAVMVVLVALVIGDSILHQMFKFVPVE